MKQPVDVTGPPPAEQLLAIVRQLASEAHPGRSYAPTLDTSFERDLGLDSLARVELLQRAGKVFAVELSSEALSEADTPRELLRFLGQAPPEIASATFPTLGGSQPVAIPGDALTLVEVLEWHAARQPERIHILLHDERHQEHPLRYGELLEAARAVAAGLAAYGLQPGQTVALMLPTGLDYLASFFGVMIAGGIPVPIYPPARMAQIEDHLQRHARILSNAEAALIITVEQARPVARMLQAAVPSLAAVVTPVVLKGVPASQHFRCRGGDIAFLQYTSGSTGEPKGVVLTHANLLANIRALGQVARATPEDVFVSWLPLYHDMGLIGAWFGSLYHGIPLVLMSPQAFLARPALWLQTIARHRGTISAAPNFAYELCVRHVNDDATLAGLDLSCWRLALNGAEPVNPATLESFAGRFAACGFRRHAITPVYGLAESSVGLAFPPLQRGPRIDVIQRLPFSDDGNALPAAGDGSDTLSIPSCGRALPGHEIRIVDSAGYELPERKVGRLEFRGPSATTGYYRNPEATAKLLGDGWLDSGDTAYTVEGEIYVTGRVKDLIKRGGRNLYPYDLEEAVGNLPGIRKGCVAVFGSPDPVTGTERLVIMAETRANDQAARTQLQHVINQCSVDVAGTPADDIVLVPPHSVLKTSSGKIRRLASRQAYEQGTVAKRAALPWLQTTHFLTSAAVAGAMVGVRRFAAWAYACYAWAIVVVIAPPCYALTMLLQRPSHGRRIARFAARLFFRLTRLSPSAKGIEHLPREPHILLVNHASYLDAIVLTALLPAAPGYAFAAKRDFANHFLMRGLLTGLDALFVRRLDARRGTEDVDVMAAALRREGNILVFPEGTFSREAGLKPFYSGAFMAAAKAGVPVVVAGLRGTRVALRSGTWRLRRTPIQFNVGKVLAPPGLDWSETVRLSAVARAEMAGLSGEFAHAEEADSAP